MNKQEELNEIIQMSRYTLNDVEANGWTIKVHTNVLAVLRKLDGLGHTND